MYKQWKIEDTVICVDVSGSMGGDDIQPTRLDAAKSAFGEFARHKGAIDPRDRIALVSFADDATVECNLTNDLRTIEASVVSLSMRGSTAIGDGLQLSLDLLRNAGVLKVPDRQPRVILLSDGGQNAGIAQPLDVARDAARNNIKIHTIAIGRSSDADPDLLRHIAQLTGGEFGQIDNLNDFLNHFTRSGFVKLISSTGGTQQPPVALKDLVPVQPQTTIQKTISPIQTTYVRQTARMERVPQPIVQCRACKQTKVKEQVYRCTRCGSFLCQTHGMESISRKQCAFCKTPVS